MRSRGEVRVRETPPAMPPVTKCQARLLLEEGIETGQTVVCVLEGLRVLIVSTTAH
jgi:hypothetical protein